MHVKTPTSKSDPHYNQNRGNNNCH